ncbi:hypothetical protein [Paenibacillus urinalis]|uniref:hypothetical protein n=1 Tax=Paenibacillus urinalis TaxID=521520 RepID=UPI00196194F0
MNPAELLTTYDLHDSVVEDVEYWINEKKVQMKVELCLWKQSNYEDTEPEMQEGMLIFSDVDKFQIEPSSFLFNSNEILDIKIQDENGEVEIILTGSKDVGVIRILARNITWEVLS